MTDTSGDTASGGLTNDMPGIGNAPPSPNHIPSALGGLARIFGILGGGRPAPPAPRPMPFGRAGVSQMAMQASPNQPRWSGPTASLFLPKGSDQPPAKFTPFISSMPREDPMQWGRQDPYPHLPQSHELPGMAQSLSKFFGQFGGGLSPILALGMGRYAGDYIKGVMMGQQYLAQQAKEKYLEYGMRLQIEEEERFRRYRNAMDEWSVHGGSTDMAKLSKMTIGGKTLIDTLGQVALETNDEPVTAMYNAGDDAGKIMDFLRLRDKQLQDLQKHNQKGAQQQADDAAAWGTPLHTEGAGSSGEGAGIKDPFTAQPQAPGGGTQPFVASGSPAPEMASSGDPFNPPQQAVTQPEDVIGNTPEDYAVTEALRTGKVPNGAELQKSDSARFNQIMTRANRIGAEAQGVLSHPINNKADYDRAMAYLKRVASPVYNDVSRNLGINDPLGGGQGGSGSSMGSPSGQYNDLIANLSVHLTKNAKQWGEIPWNQNFYQEQRDFTTKPFYVQTKARIDTLYSTGTQLTHDVQKLPDGSQSTMMRMYKAFTDGKLKATDPYVAVFGDWLNYNIEKNALLSGGRGSVTETKAAEHVVPPWAGASGYLVEVVRDSQNSLQRANFLKNTWRQIRGDPDNIPGIDQNSITGLGILSSLNPEDGTVVLNGKKFFYTAVNPFNVMAEENWRQVK